MCYHRQFELQKVTKAAQPKKGKLSASASAPSAASQNGLGAEDDPSSASPRPSKKHKKQNKPKLRDTKNAPSQFSALSTSPAGDPAAGPTLAPAVPAVAPHKPTEQQQPILRQPLAPIPVMDNFDDDIPASELPCSPADDLFGTFGEPARAMPAMTWAFASTGPALPTFPSPPPLAPGAGLGRHVHAPGPATGVLGSSLPYMYGYDLAHSQNTFALSSVRTSAQEIAYESERGRLGLASVANGSGADEVGSTLERVTTVAGGHGEQRGHVMRVYRRLMTDLGRHPQC